MRRKTVRGLSVKGGRLVSGERHEHSFSSGNHAGRKEQTAAASNGMPTSIPALSQKRLLRLISGKTDLIYSSDAFQRLAATEGDEARYHLFHSMVMAYCRPFTENHGIGTLKCEYPSFPDFPDAEMNDRHRRMLDLRNKFLGHSSIEGTKVWLLAPGAAHPATGVPVSNYDYAIEKLHFLDQRFAAWLHDIVLALRTRLDSDVAVVCKEVGSNYLKAAEFHILESGKPLKWTD
jgi:hypothetical protein